MSKFFKINANDSMTNCETNNNVSEDWKLITSKKRRKLIDKPAMNSGFKIALNEMKLTTLHFKRKCSMVLIKKMKYSVKKLIFLQTVLIATQNNVDNILINNLLKIILQIVISQNIKNDL